MDERARSLGEQAAVEPPDWALQRWGPVPDHPVARAAWVEAASEIAAYQERWATPAGPDDLAVNPPSIRAVDQWIDYSSLRPWLDLDRNDIADIAQNGPDADRNGVDDRTQTGPDRNANRVVDDIDIALANLAAAQATLERRRLPQPGLEHAADIDAGVAPDVDLGP